MLWKEIVKEVDHAFSFFGDSMKTESAKRVTQALIMQLASRVVPVTKVIYLEPEPVAQFCNRDEIWEHI